MGILVTGFLIDDDDDDYDDEGVERKFHECCWGGEHVNKYIGTKLKLCICYFFFLGHG